MSRANPSKGILRFAPSPNGLLHLGHAYAALYAYDLARARGDRFLLRIEDIDLGRSRPEFEQAIYDDLAWLGIEWEDPVRRQSEHFPEYEAALARLREMDVVYPCWATRKEIAKAISESPVGAAGWPRDPDGAPIYPGIYRDISPTRRSNLMWEGHAYAWRLDTAKAVALAEERLKGPLSFREEGCAPNGEQGELPIRPDMLGDVVIARKDVPTSYHLSVVVDDALQDISLVTRGQDLFYATYVHRLLQVLLGLPEPRYHHHDLIRDESGRRLSKTAGDTGLQALRASGRTSQDIRRMIRLTHD